MPPLVETKISPLNDITSVVLRIEVIFFLILIFELENNEECIIKKKIRKLR